MHIMQVLALRCCALVVLIWKGRLKVLKKGYSALLQASGVG